MKNQQDVIIDAHVGSRVRLRRILLGISQDKLGKALNLTFQQVQKYEKGSNRIGSSRLYHLSQILDVPVSFFFDDMPESITGKRTNSSVPPIPKPKDLKFMSDFTHLTKHQKNSLHDIVKIIRAGNSQ